MQESYPSELYRTLSSNTRSTLDTDFKEFDSIHHISYSINENGIRNVCGKDDRSKVNALHYPYNAICRLVIEDKSGNQDYGTGFFISPKCIITSGHCVFNHGNWMQRIMVIPGANGYKNQRPFGKHVSSTFKTVEGWYHESNRDFDYGAIILNDDSLFQSINTVFQPSILHNLDTTLYNSGYTDQSGKRYEQWGTSGKPTELTSHTIVYNNDTEIGNSGSPITIREGAEIKVVGIHSYGACPNHAIRINESILKVWEEWKLL